MINPTPSRYPVNNPNPAKNPVIVDIATWKTARDREDSSRDDGFVHVCSTE
jgi:hypothetical protein